MRYQFEAEVFRWKANPSFFLVSLPTAASSEIREISEGLTNGFGSIKVQARIGDFIWRTSIFPDTKSRCFDLPLKAEARKKNNLGEGSKTVVEVELLGF